MMQHWMRRKAGQDFTASDVETARGCYGRWSQTKMADRSVHELASEALKIAPAG